MPLTKVSSGVIAANAVVDSFGTQSITGDKIGLTAINANNIVNASITGAKIALGTITGDDIATGQITGNLLTANCVSGNNITTGAVAVNQLANTGDVRIQSISANTLSFYTSTIEALRIASNGDLRANSGYGSSWTSSTVYGCRAWVHFDGTGTPAIRGSGNVTSITDNGEGDYTINFTNAMPDRNYAVSGAARYASASDPAAVRYIGISSGASFSSAMNTTSVRVVVAYVNGGLQDPDVATVVIHR